MAWGHRVRHDAQRDSPDKLTQDSNTHGKNAKVNVVDKFSIGVTFRWESSLNNFYAKLVNNNSKNFHRDISRVY